MKPIRYDSATSLQVKLDGDERDAVHALSIVLGITVTEFVRRALAAEIKAAESQPTVKAALDAIRGAREHVKRRAAALAEKGARA